MPCKPTMTVQAQGCGTFTVLSMASHYLAGE